MKRPLETVIASARFICITLRGTFSNLPHIVNTNISSTHPVILIEHPMYEITLNTYACALCVSNSDT